MNWYIKVLKNYVGFDGRAHRTEYWMFTLVSFLISVGLATIDVALGLNLLASLYALAVLLPSLAVGIRRLHDTGRTGWWMLIAFVPLVGAIVLLVFFCIEGDKGDNEYGADPWASAQS